MALIKCDECGREISEKATSCPGCGAPVETSAASSLGDKNLLTDGGKSTSPNPNPSNSIGKLLLISVVVFPLAYFIGGTLQKKVQNSSSGNNSSMSGKDRAAVQETARQMAATAETTAASLVVINPKHDKQYYIDRQLQGVTECINAADFESCYKPKLEAMKYE